MKIKRYLDKDMRHVLRRVREDQGPDAVILSNRRVDDGIEVIAAIDYDEALVTIQTLRTYATEWNERVPDADISDDLALLDQFEANLTRDPYEGGYGENGYDDTYGEDPVMCSASGSSAGGLGFAFLLLVSVMRIRRRVG